MGTELLPARSDGDSETRPGYVAWVPSLHHLRWTPGALLTRPRSPTDQGLLCPGPGRETRHALGHPNPSIPEADLQASGCRLFGALPLPQGSQRRAGHGRESAQDVEGACFYDALASKPDSENPDFQSQNDSFVGDTLAPAPGGKDSGSLTRPALTAARTRILVSSFKSEN